MTTPGAGAHVEAPRRQDLVFATALVGMLAMLLVPLPSVLIDIGLSLSIAAAVLILMVALWIEKPLDFSAFPQVLLITTLLRLTLNVATTRLVLASGQEGHDAAGHVIAGFAAIVMGGDFVIGLIIFVILLLVNFIVITKGATRIAEVGARFSLDAMPGKQMAIDADLSAGLIDEREATRRRRELEEESAFFGAMDGASKFVRGDAIAAILITLTNVCGGVAVGMLRHDMAFASALDIYVRLSVGDGLVSQIPALIISLAAGLVVSKGGTRGSADRAVVAQLAGQPRAMLVAGGVTGLLALTPGLPFLPFATLSAALVAAGLAVQREAARDRERARDVASGDAAAVQPTRAGEELRAAEIEVRFGRQLATYVLRSSDDLAVRTGRLRRKLARQYGFVIPEIRIVDDLTLPAKDYRIALFGTVVASGELRAGEVLVVVGDGPRPSVRGEPTTEAAFGMPALWVPEVYAETLKSEGFAPIDVVSVLLTHVSEVIRGNLGQLFSYKDLRLALQQLEPEYQKLADEICPGHISHSTLLVVLRSLLADRVSIRSFTVILEAVAEIAPFARKGETIAEHVRLRLAGQICGDLADRGVLKVLRLSQAWEQAFGSALKRDAKGEVTEFDLDPRLIERFGEQARSTVQRLTGEGHQFVLVVAADVRPWVKMVMERLYPTLAVLSHGEISRTTQVQYVGVVQ